MAFDQYGAATVGNAGLDAPEYTSGWQVQSNTGDLESGVGPGASLGGTSANSAGFITWSGDPYVGTWAGAAGPATGDAVLCKVWMPQATKVTNVNLWNTTVGNDTVALAGVYNSAGSLLASSADFHAALANGLQTVALSTATVIPMGWNYVAVGQVGSTTAFEALTWAAPTSFNECGYTAAASMTLSTLSSSPNTAQRFFIGATGITTALPSTLVAAQFAATTVGYWVALN